MQLVEVARQGREQLEVEEFVLIGPLLGCLQLAVHAIVEFDSTDVTRELQALDQGLNLVESEHRRSKGGSRELSIELKSGVTVNREIS